MFNHNLRQSPIRSITERTDRTLCSPSCIQSCAVDNGQGRILLSI